MKDGLEGQMTIFDLDPAIWSGRMSPERSVQTKEKTFKRFSPKSSESSDRTRPMFLYLIGGGWSKSGCIMGYGATGCPFSIAWRLHDAQFWGTTQYVDGRMLTRGTPQRRKRIALIADFGGVSAPEILFERKGLCWHPEQSCETREGTPGDSEEGIGDTEPG